MAFGEISVVEDAAVKRDGGLDAFDDEFVEGCGRLPQGCRLTDNPMGTGPGVCDFWRELS